ncbi:STAS domain-containing protein [Actinoplanes sp. NPDC049548]|uniref:STAS domain-containing protein n=1 Tax=Actinoplanes sp. NPDC049548 TaxID=3155152 RepID=UPI003441C511
MTARDPRRITLDGELTIMTAAAHKDRLLSALPGNDGLRVDMSGVEEIDTAGLQVLLLVRREAQRLELPFEIGAAGGSVAEVLAMAGLATAEEG